MHNEIWGLFSRTGACERSPKLPIPENTNFGKGSRALALLNAPSWLPSISISSSDFFGGPKKAGGRRGLHYCCYEFDYTSDEIEKTQL